MKIISGKYKGRNLEGFDIVGTRPTMDRVKESLFGTIQNYIDDSVVLDLFSGSGNLGLEALSEGAKYAYLVDHNHKAIKIINKNISTIGITDVRYCKVFRFLFVLFAADSTYTSYNCQRQYGDFQHLFFQVFLQCYFEIKILLHLFLHLLFLFFLQAFVFRFFYK